MGALTTAFLVASTVASGVAGAVGQRKAGQAARAQGEYEGSIFDLNAADAERQAQDALFRGSEQESLLRQDTRGLIGSQRAGLAAQGLDITSGSALAVQEDAAYLGELDAMTLRNNARREALGLKTQAVNLRAQGQMARRGGRNQQRAANTASVGTLLTSGVQAAGIGIDYYRRR